MHQFVYGYHPMEVEQEILKLSVNPVIFRNEIQIYRYSPIIQFTQLLLDRENAHFFKDAKSLKFCTKVLLQKTRNSMSFLLILIQ